MKKALIKVLPILVMLIINSAYGQSNVQQARYKYGDKELRKFWGKKLDQARKENDLNVCLISVTFARFTVDRAGNINNISISENSDTPKAFREILTSLIKATSGSWLPATINNKPVESKPFILPFIYQMEAGCYANGKHVNDGTSNAVVGFFQEFGNNSQLDCILLSPLIVFSQN